MKISLHIFFFPILQGICYLYQHLGVWVQIFSVALLGKLFDDLSYYCIYGAIRWNGGGGVVEERGGVIISSKHTGM